MAPIFDKAAKELEPRARFAKLNVDEEPAIAARYGIRGIAVTSSRSKMARSPSSMRAWSISISSESGASTSGKGFRLLAEAPIS